MFIGESYDAKFERLERREVSAYVAANLRYFCQYYDGTPPASTDILKTAAAMPYIQKLDRIRQETELHKITAEEAIAYVASLPEVP